MGVQDPFVYTDREGVFHAVFHNQLLGDNERVCGGHAFSLNGIDWTYTGTAWGSTVEFEDGTNYTYSRRERPHLIFDDALDPHVITGLTTGVMYGPAAPTFLPGQDACYTLYQPVAV